MMTDLLEEKMDNAYRIESCIIVNPRDWRNPEKRVSCDPRGGNVLRGLSNKCLMRGTFPAIFIFE